MRGSALHHFLVTPAQVFGLPVCRLGLASYGRTAISPDDVLSAVDRGINFLNWLRTRNTRPSPNMVSGSGGTQGASAKRRRERRGEQPHLTATRARPMIE